MQARGVEPGSARVVRSIVRPEKLRDRMGGEGRQLKPIETVALCRGEAVSCDEQTAGGAVRSDPRALDVGIFGFTNNKIRLDQPVGRKERKSAAGEVGRKTTKAERDAPESRRHRGQRYEQVLPKD